MFKPNIYVKHVSDIDYDKLQSKGIKLLCFDLDNTLDIPDRETLEILPDILPVLDKIENMGFDIFIISNNSIENRAASFAKLRNYQFVDWARKPFQKTYKTNQYINQYQVDQMCFIGDKIVTDVIGGNRYGATTVLVDPLFPNKKHWYTNIMNAAEKFFCAIVGFKRGNYYDKV